MGWDHGGDWGVAVTPVLFVKMFTTAICGVIAALILIISREDGWVGRISGLIALTAAATTIIMMLTAIWFPSLLGAGVVEAVK